LTLYLKCVSSRSYKQSLWLRHSQLIFIATILNHSGEKQQQRFQRNDDGMLDLKNELYQKNVMLLLANQQMTSGFRFTTP